MKIYHWHDIAGRARYYASREEAEKGIKREGVGARYGVQETDALELLHLAEERRWAQGAVVRALCERLAPLVEENLTGFVDRVYRDALRAERGLPPEKDATTR